MTRQIFASALIAGLAAGTLAFLLQYLLINPLTFEAELFETGVREHFKASLTAAVQSPAGLDAPVVQGVSGIVQDMGFSIIAYTAFGLILVSGMALAAWSGHAIGASQGILWGAAGFVTAQLAPALGLPPEPPGVVATEVGLRQAWLIGCMISTAAGLAFLAFGRGATGIAVAAVLIALPHVWGAPHLDTYFGIVPPELAARYVTASLAVSALGWVVLGWVATTIWTRLEPA